MNTTRRIDRGRIGNGNDQAAILVVEGNTVRPLLNAIGALENDLPCFADVMTGATACKAFISLLGSSSGCSRMIHAEGLTRGRAQKRCVAYEVVHWDAAIF